MQVPSESLGPKHLLVSLEFVVMGGKGGGVVVCEMVTEIRIDSSYSSSSHYPPDTLLHY